LLLCLRALPESILEATSHRFHITHTSCSSCFAILRFLPPIIATRFGVWVSTRRTCLLLDVERGLPAATASCVRLIMSLTERSRSFRLYYQEESHDIVISIRMIPLVWCSVKTKKR